MSTITIHNKEYRIYEVTGKILESNKQRELHVYGSGGGGATYNGTGGTAPVNIQSSTTIHDEFFLIDQDGQEHSIKLKNWDVSLREGHEIQVIWVISPNQERGPYVVLNNHSLRNITTQNDIIREISIKHYAKKFWLSIVAVIVLSFIFKSFIFFLIIAIATWFYWNKKSKEVFKELKQAIENIIN